jgi:hypothetical protein
MNFEEFIQQIQSDVIERSHGGGDDNNSPSDFKENIYTQLVSEYLIDFGALDEVTVCYCEQKTSNGYIKVNGFYFDEDEGRLDLITTIYGNGTDGENIGKVDTQQAIERAIRFFRTAIKGFYKQMEPASDRYSMLRYICEAKENIEQVRIFVLANGVVLTDQHADNRLDKYGYEFRVQIWDLQRLYRCVSSGKSYEATAIDFDADFGATIPCISINEDLEEYNAYVAILSGRILSQIYDEYGSKLLELNVRSFLQVNGKVNKEIRRTLRENPNRFLAYNNGISATAEEIEFIDYGNGMYAIKKIKGLQIVNGGQTMASIHRAAKIDKADLSKVFVQAKITLVDSDKLQDVVPLISKYANSQNKINEADFSSNEPYHVELQRLAERIWVPGEQSRWFYERARGQYQVLKSREATTTAKKKKFEKEIPSSQKFNSTELAKYLNSWDGKPYFVSLGGQKNFCKFMDDLRKTYGKEWKPDVTYYKQVIGKSILFKSTEKIIKNLKVPSYKNAIANYLVAYLSHRTEGHINFLKIWDRQSLTEGIDEALKAWCPIIQKELIKSAGEANVLEWAKNSKCWTHISSLELQIPLSLKKELDAEKALANTDRILFYNGSTLSLEDQQNLAKVMNVKAIRWLEIYGWGVRTGMLQSEQCNIVLMLSGYATSGWNHVPSPKQTKQAAKILDIADANIKMEA